MPPPTASARAKLYPRADPRMVFHPANPVAGALAPVATLLTSISAPNRNTFVITHAASSEMPLDPADATGSRAYELVVSRPKLSRTPFTAELINADEVTLLSVRALPGMKRGALVYHIYDESTLVSTKGMPKRIPIYTLRDRAHETPGAFVDAVLSKSGKPVARIQVQQPYGPDVAWTVYDADSDKSVATFYDFIPDPNAPPTVSAKLEPPFCNRVPVMLCMWSIVYELYTKRSASRQRRR